MPSDLAREAIRFCALQLRDLKGRFILSINDRPEVREIFEGFSMVPEPVTYTVAKAGAVPAGELIIEGSSNGFRSVSG